ncbi:MAG: hypothetical protein A2498_06025 [Lentisphaerae bacterium RIFOXYC12_FULL_60_16]|nr:MAG: hypothetical protein A2498_06025 [Lentisphaerae bacterium RIFOXYC12_FULL_60_16]
MWGLVGAAHAQANLAWCLEYMTRDYPGSTWLLQDDGAGVYIREWHSALAKPEQGQVEAVWPEAQAWKTDQIRSAQADFERWDRKELVALVKLLVKEINILRQNAGLPERTASDVKQALKAEL